jgi:peroxiredoxin
LAKYGDLYAQFQAAGAGVAALSVDDAVHSEAVRQEYALPFPILCDTRHEVVKAWGLYNAKEKGGIAVPATFLLDGDATVRAMAREGVASRLSPEDLLGRMRARGQTTDAQAARLRLLFPTLRMILRTVWPAVRLALNPPKR